MVHLYAVHSCAHSKSTLKSGAFHEALCIHLFSHVDTDNGLKDLVWTILLGPDRGGHRKQGKVLPLLQSPSDLQEDCYF